MRANIILCGAVCLSSLLLIHAQQPEGSAPASPPPEAARKKKGPGRPPRPGVSTPGVKREMSTVTPVAVFTTGGTPDWQVLTDDAVWVANGPMNTIHRLDVRTNRVAATVTVGKRPCSGLAAGFGSIWVPNCGDKTLSRVDMKTNEVTATLPVGPAESEGGIAVSPDAVWLVTDAQGKLSRIDPKTNSVVARIDVPAGSASVIYGDGAVWVTTPAKNMLTRIDTTTNQVTDSIEVGPGPRFQTFGAHSVWTLNQGDGTVSRVDTKTRKVVAGIEVGIPGGGGEIAFGFGHVWATVFQIPISEIDPDVNKVIRQWTGNGGDSIRAGHGSIFLSNLRDHNVWRIDPKQF
jgi:YVTN family beta-propeller protein